MNDGDDSENAAVGDGGPRRKKQWSDLSPEQRKAAVLGGIAELVLTTIALRDLRRRPAEDVRGWKPLWVLGCAVQPIGPVLYLLVGRRRPGR